MKTLKIFITGTDTNVGKTYITSGIIRYLEQKGLSTLGIKPIASGSEETKHGLRNQDALILQASNRIYHSYEVINPIAFKPAIAPHIAAEQSGKCLSLADLHSAIHTPFSEQVCLIEGAGGWLVPINSTETFADFAMRENLPVILVIAIRLGCINHALLTAESIHRAGLKLWGWIANFPTSDDMPCALQNIESIQSRINAPCLGIVPYGELPENCLAWQ